MLNKLRAFLKEQALLSPGDRVIAAVSCGADSVAMLFALYLLRDELGITLEVAHFNHHLRGAESDRDEAFVTDFCGRYCIPLHLGSGRIVSGKRAWKRRPGMPGTRFCGVFPERLPPPIPPMTMPRRCSCA